MEETSEELPNFCIGIDLLGPDPTSSKNKAELKKNSQVALFTNLSEDQLQEILDERHSLGTEQTPTGHQQHLRVKSPFLIVVFNFVTHFYYLRTIRLKQENFSRNNNTNYTRRHKFITHKNNCCQVFSRSRNDQPMLVNEYKFKEG